MRSLYSPARVASKCLLPCCSRYGSKDNRQGFLLCEYKLSLLSFPSPFTVSCERLAVQTSMKRMLVDKPCLIMFSSTHKSWLAPGLSWAKYQCLQSVLGTDSFFFFVPSFITCLQQLIRGLSPSCSAVSIESPWQAPSNCRISHLPVLESSGNRDSVPDIPLEQFTSSCASSWPLDEPTIS